MKQVFSLRLNENKPFNFTLRDIHVDWQSNLIFFLLLLAFIYGGSWIQVFDSIAAPLDIGIFTVLLFAMLAVLMLLRLIRQLHESLWTVFKDFRQFELTNQFKNLTSWQQLIIYFASFFGISLLVALLSIAIF